MLNLKNSKRQLQSFYEITIADPLFAAEGLDLDNVEWALDELKYITKKLEIVDQSIIGKIFFLLYPLEKTLHPISFLKSFLKSERARRHFLSNPNFISANELLNSYKVAVNALETDLTLYRSACVFIRRMYESRYPNNIAYDYYHRRVSFTHFIMTLDLMKENIKTLSEEINYREKIIRGTNKNIEFNLKKSKTTNGMMKEKIPIKKGYKKVQGQLHELYTWMKDEWVFKDNVTKRFGPMKIEEFGPFFYQLSNFDRNPTSRFAFSNVGLTRK